MLSSKETYEKEGVVYWYRTRDKLQKPEQTILDLIKDKLPEWRVLDLGVGGGRTAIHFGEPAKEYIGVDFSEAMIEVCNKRFPKRDNISFAVADAADLHAYEDGSFDFVIFSANGIDSINFDQRTRAHNEAKRVLKPGGVYAFSSHNLQAAWKLYRPSFAGKSTVKDMLWEIIRPFGMVVFNGLPGKFSKMDWSPVNDGTHQFQLNNLYVAPEFQAKQLQELGFTNIRHFSLETGKEIASADLKNVQDPWIYYLCSK